MTRRLKKKETIAHAKNLFINPTMQHRQTILSTVENQPLPSTSNNLYSPRLVEVTPSETRRLLAPYSPAFRHPTPPPMAKRGPWKTRRRLLSKISLHAGQARPSLSRGIVERGWRGYEGGRRKGEKDTVCWTGWRMERDGRGGMERRGRVERRGLARRSARTTRSICMLGDVDHVGRGWPATGGCWLANGHPKATPTPTHGVLKPRRSDNHPIYLGEQPPQKQRDVGGGCYRWMHDANTLYTPLTLLPNSVESSKIENRLVFTFVFLLFSFSWLFYRMGGGWGRIMSPSLHHDGMIRLSRCLGNTVLEFWRNWFSYLLFLFPVGC